MIYREPFWRARAIWGGPVSKKIVTIIKNKKEEKEIVRKKRGRDRGKGGLGDMEYFGSNTKHRENQETEKRE